MRLSFSERNPAWIGVIGLVVLTIFFSLTFYSDALPGVRGKTYSAELAESAGITEGAEVRVAGVKVGKVSDVYLDGAKVIVEFRAKGVSLGEDTSAAIKIKSLLGQKYLALTPAGSGELDKRIPLDRTTVPYDVALAFEDLGRNTGAIDTEQMAKSFDVLADSFEETPKALRGMLKGMSALANTISKRDDELASLMQSSAQVTDVFGGLSTEIETLLNDGNLLLAELESRREAIHQLLVGTQELSKQLTALVKENEAELSPALAKLDKVSRILNRNHQEIDSALRKIGPYYRMLTAATGSGRWVDSYVCGLYNNDKRPQLDAKAVRDCQPVKGGN